MASGAAMGEIPGVRDGAVKDGEGGDGKGSGFDLLNYLGFVWAELSATEVSGSLLVKPNSSQPFGVLHGGVTAFLAESLASFGAGIAAREYAVSGLELSIICSLRPLVPRTELRRFHSE
ncbi:1,4-dihydroxy-2-naphthoyl-CoA thioesterase 2 isoform X1 [Physcomitrium patens]|uniref:1,4-dihydroxy-2-naphthoyl-CoA thioesterase 2 isoform X1 n=1 Tax=Physcomitrium patens TaxID=3218 RepID=UPI000D159582|nr:1,4-dihydroxy-2-naphthoyl-CoA thioesterase 2-like isoform X1 [Physcomitrium patens]|eukprot:XP_024363594.1 1,4-dihydroxy-2-naphthoyl-CoA thioesterase 2-like isoform X1 [Physcomitrella patens]